MQEQFDLERYTACDCAEHVNQTCDKCALRGYIESLRASLTRVEEERDDLAMIIRRIAYRNNRDLPIEQTIVGALEYLTRKGLMGSPLRADDDGLSRTRGGAGD